MLFNSYLFLLVFLPLVLAGFYGVGHLAGRTGGLLWVVIAIFGGNGAAFSTTHHILIPLGIFFITFQQIAFLVDTYKGKLTEGSALEYVLFITFFPQLILGPIVHYRELQPQFRSAGLFRWNPDNFSLGMCIFIVGLFKKVVLGNTDGFFDDFPLHQ